MFQKIRSAFSFDRPAHLLAVFVAVSGLIWVVQTSLLQRVLPLDAVEAVVWGNQMQWGQMKSPPLSGWMAALFRNLSGGSDWALYLLAELMVVAGLWFVYKLAREFLEEYESATATLLLFFIFYYNPPAMKFCSHDTLLLLLPAMTLFFVRAWKKDRLTDWILLAVFSALAVLGKYAAFQLLAAYAAVTLFTKQGRKLLRSYKPYLCAGLFLLLLFPHIYWLFENDFLSIRHMGGRLEEKYKWYQPFEMFAALLYPYISCLLLLFLITFLRNRKVPKVSESKKEISSFLLPIALIPPGIYVVLSICGNAVIGQWFSYFAYMSGIIAVLLWPYQCGRKEFKRLFTAAAAFFVILLIATSIDVIIKPRLRIHTDPQEIVKAGSDFLQRCGAGEKIPDVVYGDRWTCGVMELYSDLPFSACNGNDICTWNLLRDRVRQKGMLIIYRKAPPETLPLLPEVKTAGLRSGTFRIRFSSQSGKSKENIFWIGYLPPQ